MKVSRPRALIRSGRLVSPASSGRKWDWDMGCGCGVKVATEVLSRWPIWDERPPDRERGGVHHRMSFRLNAKSTMNAKEMNPLKTKQMNTIARLQAGQ